MSILTMFDLSGDPDQLLAVQDEKMDSVIKPISEQNGILSSLVVKTENGLMVVNHWESKEGMEKAFSEIRPQMEGAGMPAPENHREHEVLRDRSPGR
jgi:hypothetical protein